MPSFTYTARDESGAPTNGILQALSIADAGQQIRAGGKYPITIQPADALDKTGPTTFSRGGIRISRADLIQIAQQLSIMIETGVTLTEALECIASQAIKPNVKKLMKDLSMQVQSGTDFSAALAKHPRSFPRVFVALIKAAEKSGMMSKLINRATVYLRDEQDTVRKVKGALTYPAIMLSFALTTTIFLLAFVLPRFTTIYASKGAALPVPTKVLMMMSDFVVGHWLMLVLSTVAVATSLFFYIRTEGGTRTFHLIQIKLPLLGPMFRKMHLARGLRMLGTMAGAGVNLVDCVTTAHDLCGNVYYRDLWNEVSSEIQTGKQMSEVLTRSELVPQSVSQMIHSGEKGGKLAMVTEQVAGFSEAELKETITELTRYIEPAMIIVMGFIIGGVAMALMLPIFTISRVVAK